MNKSSKGKKKKDNIILWFRGSAAEIGIIELSVSAFYFFTEPLLSLLNGHGARCMQKEMQFTAFKFTR